MVDMSAYLVYPQRFEDIYQIYDGSKKSNAIKCHLGWVLTKLLYPISPNSNLTSKYCKPDRELARIKKVISYDWK